MLLGVTGSGKTFTMANVIAAMNKPALVIAPNKTLAAQLYNEFKALFPDNAVRYFVSYYDYYQPEAYVPSTDTYIEKDASINDEIDKMRHSATKALLERNDVLIVASVSCIYGLGSPEAYFDMLLFLERGARADRDEVLRKLVDIQYERNDVDFHRGTFRVRGDVVEIFPVYEEARAIRIEFFGDTVEAIADIDPLRGRVLRRLDRIAIYPASHYVTTLGPHGAGRRGDSRRTASSGWRRCAARASCSRRSGSNSGPCTISRCWRRWGSASGIENYSRHLTGRAPGEAPPTLLNYFPSDCLVFIDESHVTVPQIGGMYRGDRSRKETLVEFGFRLPSALDNRPLNFQEFEALNAVTVYVSATPGDYELRRAGGVVVEQLIRPTGLLDPEVEVRPAGQQVDDLLEEIRTRVAADERVLVTTLTKKMAEDLTDYYRELGVRVRYLHSDIETLERVKIIRDLRRGEFDVLVGINLLREGLDLPEVSLVAILDADKEGYLRSERSLIQTIGRAARNVHGTVIMYADRVTESMRRAIDETRPAAHDPGRPQRRTRNRPADDPEGDRPAVGDRRRGRLRRPHGGCRRAGVVCVALADIPKRIAALQREMRAAAADLEFERAATLRDEIQHLQARELALRGD